VAAARRAGLIDGSGTAISAEEWRHYWPMTVHYRAAVIPPAVVHWPGEDE